MSGMNSLAARIASLLVCAALGGLVPPAALGAPSVKEKTAELKALRARIAKVQSTIHATRTRMDAVMSDLREKELAIAKATKRLQEIDAGIDTRQRKLTALQKKKAQREQDIADQRDALARQIRSAYMAGSSDYLKLLLNQQDPALLGRSMVYYTYFNRARTRRIAKVTRTLKDLVSLREAIKLETDKLRQLKADQEAKIKDIDQNRKARQILVAKLRQKLKGRTHELQGLRENAKQLERLVDALRQAHIDVPEPAAAHGKFADLRGRLRWPATGPITGRFGSPRKDGTLRWHGVMIRAKPGTEVHAVDSGRVIFADWFRNMGLLIIIDHGDGYMSLYGHNQTLYKSIGDWVNTGDVIGTVGDTGGLDGPGLYFEIRHNGNPQNPALWCKRG